MECQGQDVTLVFETLFETICGKCRNWQNPQIPDYLGEMPGLANLLNSDLSFLFFLTSRLANRRAGKNENPRDSSLFTSFGNAANFGKWLGICPFCQSWHLGQMVRYLVKMLILAFSTNSHKQRL